MSPSSAERPSSGRFVLYLSRRDADLVEYDGAFEIEGRTAPCVARVALPGGSVDIQATGSAVPGWLADAAKGVLRAAFRATRSGVPWPRRIHRFREARAGGSSGGAGEDE